MKHAQKGSRWSSNQLAVLAYLAPALFVAAGCGDTATQPALEVQAVSFARSGGAALPAWSASGPGTVNLLSDGVTTDPAMSYSLSGSVVSNTQTFELSTTATQGGAVTLPFTYSGFHAFFHVRVFVNAFVTNGSGTTTIPLISQFQANCCTPPSGGFDLSGSVTLNVAPGDVYGFRFGGSNQDSDSRLLGTFLVDLLHPDDKDECKEGGWEAFRFKNQGQCVRFETGKDSRFGG